MRFNFKSLFKQAENTVGYWKERAELAEGELRNTQSVLNKALHIDGIMALCGTIAKEAKEDESGAAFVKRLIAERDDARAELEKAKWVRNRAERDRVKAETKLREIEGEGK